MARSASILSRSLAMLVASLTVTTLISSASAQFQSKGQTQPRKQSKFEPLRDVIQATIAPNTWDQVGGEGSIIIVDTWGVAVVSQTQEIHNEIEALLATIRRVRQQQDANQSVSPEETRPSSVHRTTDSPQRNEIESALGSKTELDFIDAPLREVVETLEEQHQIPIEIDKRALEESGLTLDAPVTISVSGISLRSALKLCFRDLGLVFLIQDEVLQVTTPEEAETRLTTVVYPVKDLAASVD